MDIRCRKKQCQFNDRFTCTAKELLVDSNDICKSFLVNQNKNVSDSSKKIFRKIPKYAPQRDTKHMKIECKNKCVLNKNGRCIANGITINDINEKPYCMTFVKN